jgi:hypothetical protein
VFKVVCEVFVVDKDIVKKNEHKFPQIRFKQVIHKALEGRRGISETNPASSGSSTTLTNTRPHLD